MSKATSINWKDSEEAIADILDVLSGRKPSKEIESTIEESLEQEAPKIIFVKGKTKTRKK